MSEPKQKPGKSKQDYGTPRALIAAVEERFGALTWDLAASAENAKAPSFFTKEQDTLVQDWTRLRGNLWLNPEFADLEPYAIKCRESKGDGRRIFLLTPASIGSCWFANHVHGHALVLGLSPRLTFEGCTAPYPKDCMLSVFGRPPGFDVWRWTARLEAVGQRSLFG